MCVFSLAPRLWLCMCLQLVKLLFLAVTAQWACTRAQGCGWDYSLVPGEPWAGQRACSPDSRALGKLFLLPAPLLPGGAAFSDVICETTPATKAPHCHICLRPPPGLLSWLAYVFQTMFGSECFHHCTKLIKGWNV